MRHGMDSSWKTKKQGTTLGTKEMIGKTKG
jgi:hypothetical protein